MKFVVPSDDLMDILCKQFRAFFFEQVIFAGAEGSHEGCVTITTLLSKLAAPALKSL